MRRLFLLLLISLAVSWGPSVNTAFGQSDSKTTTDGSRVLAPTDLRGQIKQWQNSIRDAGKLFKDGQVEQSAALIGAVQKGVLGAAKGSDKKKIRMLKPVYLKLARAHKLLASKGANLSPLQPLPDPAAIAVTNVSFVAQIAPMIVSKCGNCHVNQERGGFSAASFMALDQSAMIAYGLPEQSRIVEVIENGEMPKGNLKVTPEELRLLKAWVAEGANFDGKNPNASLASFGPRMPKPKKAPVVDLASMALTGKETISFAVDVAPILLDNCAECHIAGRQSRNLNMASLASLLQGGDSGAALTPGNSGTSEIVLRLKGEGRDVMPPNGKLDDDQIAKISKWIDEGARFEPVDVSYPLDVVARKGLANSMDHEQMTAVRDDASRKLWKLAYSDLEASETKTDNFLVFGTGSKARLANIGQQAESLASRTASVLKSQEGDPFIKGKASLFVVDKRYDFSEFGKMVEKRQFSRSISSSWNADGAEAYIVLLAPFSSEESSYELTLARDLAAVHVSGWNPTIPRWFADGMAYWTVAKMFKRNKALVNLDRSAASAVAQMKKPDDFISGKISADQAALVGYQFVSSLQSNSRSFKRLLKALREKEGFDQAFEQSYGISPKEFFGKAADNKKW